MLESAWIFVGRIAFAWTIITVLAAVYVDPRDSNGDTLTMVGGVLGFILWAVWTFGALNVEVQNGSQTTAFAQPELAILGVTMALIPAYLALTGPIELISRYRDVEMKDL